MAAYCRAQKSFGVLHPCMALPCPLEAARVPVTAQRHRKSRGFMSTSMRYSASVPVLSFIRQPVGLSGEGYQRLSFIDNSIKIKKRKTDASVTQEAFAFRRKDP